MSKIIFSFIIFLFSFNLLSTPVYAIENNSDISGSTLSKTENITKVEDSIILKNIRKTLSLFGLSDENIDKVINTIFPIYKEIIFIISGLLAVIVFLMNIFKKRKMSDYSKTKDKVRFILGIFILVISVVSVFILLYFNLSI